MLMLSESSEESATFFLHNNFNALEQREGFYSIHIQSCLKALCDGHHNQISAQKINSRSHHCINCLEESEKMLWNPARSTDSHRRWGALISFLNMRWKETRRLILVSQWVCSTTLPWEAATTEELQASGSCFESPFQAAHLPRLQRMPQETCWLKLLF